MLVEVVHLWRLEPGGLVGLELGSVTELSYDLPAASTPAG